MRNIVLVVIFVAVVASCNGLSIRTNDKDERNGEIITYLRDLKEGVVNRSDQPEAVDRISKIFHDVFRPQEPPRQPSFFERIINFFRNINIFGLRFNRPPPEDELQCIDSNDLRCSEVFKGIRNGKHPIFFNTRTPRDDEETPIFFLDDIKKATEKREVAKKEVKKHYIDIEMDPVDQD